jgi:hypothetical protein
VSKKQLVAWRNRIVGHGEERPDQLLANPRNWRIHPKAQQDALKGVLSEVGWVQSVIVNRASGHLVDGHARVALAISRNEPSVPVVYVELSEEEEALVLATLDPISAMAKTDAEAFDALIKHLEVEDAAIAAVIEGTRDYHAPIDKDARPNPRQLPIDLIFTLQMADCTCCLAVQAGLKYGIQSKSYRLCPYHDQLGERHKVVFIDNNYFDYEHAVHLDAVRALRPKYATVMDIVTPQQAEMHGVKRWYPFEQILDFAEELSQYAENVIVIPKYDCLDKIPDKFMLGYSVPTSHGGTPLPVEAFRGRRVHLLGGSWADQLAYWAHLQDEVVSMDNNHVMLIASKYGCFVLPNGEVASLKEYNLGYLANPRYAAFALSFGAMAAKINEIMQRSDIP